VVSSSIVLHKAKEETLRQKRKPAPLPLWETSSDIGKQTKMARSSRVSFYQLSPAECDRVERSMDASGKGTVGFRRGLNEIYQYLRRDPQVTRSDWRSMFCCFMDKLIVLRNGVERKSSESPGKIAGFRNPMYS